MNISTVHFGVALPDAAHLSDLPGIPAEAFDVLEVPGESLGTPELKEFMAAFPGVKLRGGELMERSLLALIPEASGKLRSDFVSEVGRRLELAHERGAVAAALPIDFGRAFADGGYRRALIALLQELSGRFFREKIAMVFPARIPSGEGESPQDYLSFLRELMYPAELELALHVHEPAYGGGDWTEKMALPALGSGAAQLVYEPGTGNRLNVRQLRQAAEFLAAHRRDATVFFAPRGGELTDLLAGEMSGWRDMINQLREEAENVEIGS